MRPSLSGILIAIVIGAFVLATGLFGWPKDIQSAGSFAEFVGTLLSPASLIVLVLSLNAQSRTERQGTENHFLSLQVEALIALIEDDRYKLSGMSDTGKKNTPAFNAVLTRYGSRVGKLNEFLGRELRLPAMAEKDAMK